VSGRCGRENGRTIVAVRSADFRNKAAAALRSGRKAATTDDRNAHFEVAASYKALANDVEWMHGERQRSYRRKKKPKA
jgi:hypothetical protein